MSNQPTTSYRETQPVLPDSDEDQQVGNQQKEEGSPLPQSTPSPSAAHFSDDYQDQDYSDPQALTSDATLPDVTYNLPSTSAEFNISSQPIDYNPLITYPKPEPTITLSKQQLHTIPEPPPVQVYQSQPTVQNPILPSQSTQPTNHTMANPHQVGINALPIQGKRDAPRTFKGNYDKVEDFLGTMDKLYACYQVHSQKDKVDAILPYCSTKVQDFIKTSPAYKTPHWNNLKAHMMDYYDAERASRKYVHRDIIEFTNKWTQKPITNLTTWKKYFRDYHVMAGSMLERGEMSQKDFETYFWLGLPDNLRAIFEPKIQAQIPNYDASQPYKLEEIEAVAQNYFKRNKFTEMVFNPLHYQRDEESDSESDDSSDDSDSDSDYDRKRRR